MTFKCSSQLKQFYCSEAPEWPHTLTKWNTRALIWNLLSAFWGSVFSHVSVYCSERETGIETCYRNWFSSTSRQQCYSKRHFQDQQLAALSLQPIPISLALEWQNKSDCFKQALLRGITKEEHQQLPSASGAEHSLAECCTEAPGDEFSHLPVSLWHVNYFWDHKHNLWFRF